MIFSTFSKNIQEKKLCLFWIFIENIKFPQKSHLKTLYSCNTLTEKRNVLTIPKEYLIDEDKVKTDSGLATITTGLQNMEYIEVLSGITKNTYINKP